MLIARQSARPRSLRAAPWPRRGPRKMNCSTAACPLEIALYLLPNAKAIRLVETGSLLHLLHKWTMRTCFNAQEEIYQASMEEVRAGSRRISRTCAIYRAAVLHSRRHRHAHLHRRLAFLRRESLAGFSQHPAANMTRQGSLAYYLAAWVCGCLFMSSFVWARAVIVHSPDIADLGVAFSFLVFNFYGLMLGAPTALLVGFLLRRAARLAKYQRSWQWMILGATLSSALIVAFWFLDGIKNMTGRTMASRAVSFFGTGPQIVVDSGWWLAVPAGAATAWVLYRVHRAFAVPLDWPARLETDQGR